MLDENPTSWATRRAAMGRTAHLFKGRPFTAAVILWAVRWSLFPIRLPRPGTYAERSRRASRPYNCLLWSQDYAPERDRGIRRPLRRTTSSGRVDGTHG
jgi:IS6 family transposase